ncbi:MAG: hypothetical protein HYS13_25950 [Planctomycetia bacterium]|nr:hypothetical protein [Planctomycetia bacterium]
MNDKVLCRTPTPGKKPTRIDRWKFDAVRKAILRIVPKQGRGVLFMELPKLVKAKVSAKERAKLGNFSWYTTSVKLEMEVRGELRRVPDAQPQRLLRA